jgi:acetamidase/formamidase
VCGKSDPKQDIQIFYLDYALGTAIETPMRVTVKLTVLKDQNYLRVPHFSFKEKRSSHGEEPEEYYCITAVEPDLLTATRSATRNMIDFLCREHGLTRPEAYMLCSVAGDLKMLEVVSLSGFWKSTDGW